VHAQLTRLSCTPPKMKKWRVRTCNDSQRPTRPSLIHCCPHPRLRLPSPAQVQGGRADSWLRGGISHGGHHVVSALASVLGRARWLHTQPLPNNHCLLLLLLLHS
jgi:hypothetical protein